MWERQPLPGGMGSCRLRAALPVQKAGEDVWAANPHLERERLCGSGEDMLHGIECQNILRESSSAPGVRELLGIASRLRSACPGRTARVCQSCEYCFT